MNSRRTRALGIVSSLVLGSVVQAGSIAPPAGTIPILSDDFEGYANDTAFKSVWNGAASTTYLASGAGTNGTNGLVDNSGMGVRKNFAPRSFSDSAPLFLEFDCWTYAASWISGDQHTVGLADAAGTTQFELGRYTGMYFESFGPYTPVSGQGFRTYGVGGLAYCNGWVGVTRWGSDAYNHCKLEIGSTYCEATVRLGGNGNGSVYTMRVNLTSVAGQTIDHVTIGRPVASDSWGTSLFDNLQIYQVPEPATLTLVAFGGCVLRRTRRR